MNGVLGSNLAWLLGLLIQVVIVVTALIYVPRRRKPTAAMAWLLLIFLFPFFGILFYLLIGNFRLPKKRRDEQARIDGDHPRDRARVGPRDHGRRPGRAGSSGSSQQNEDLTGLPASGGNEATLLGDYQGSIDAMAAEIDTATQLRARRVLHRGVGRHDPRILRRDGARGRARRERAAARRPHLVARRSQRARRPSPSSTASA